MSDKLKLSPKITLAILAALVLAAILSFVFWGGCNDAGVEPDNVAESETEPERGVEPEPEELSCYDDKPLMTNQLSDYPDSDFCIKFLWEEERLQLFASSESDSLAMLSLHFYYIPGGGSELKARHIIDFFRDLEEAPDLTFISEDYTADYFSDKLVRVSIRKYYDGIEADYDKVLEYLSEDYQQLSETEKTETDEAIRTLMGKISDNNEHIISRSHDYNPNDSAPLLKVSDNEFSFIGEKFSYRVSFTVHNPSDNQELISCTHRESTRQSSSGSLRLYIVKPGNNSFDTTAGGGGAALTEDNFDSYSRRTDCQLSWI